MTEEFRFPEIGIGTLVEVSTDPNFTGETLGIVVTPKSRSADIAIFRGNGAHGIVRSALHRDDPRIKTQPNRFDPERGYDDSGVFQLAGIEVTMQEIRRDQAGVRQMLAQILRRLALLESQRDEHGKPEAALPKRPRGRPRKERPEEVTEPVVSG